MATNYQDMTPATAADTQQAQRVSQRTDVPVAHPATQSFWDKINPANPDSFWADTVGTPGSKTDAAIRGLTQGSTLGLGNKAQALIRSAVPGNPTYAELRDQGDVANANAASAHPIAYTAGNIVGSIPSSLVVGGGSRAAALGSSLEHEGALASAKYAAQKLLPSVTNPVARATVGGAAAGGTLGAVQGLGQTSTDVGDQLSKMAGGAGVGAAAGALGGGLGEKVHQVKTWGAPLVQSAAAPSLGALGGLAGVMPGTEKVDSSLPAADQAVQYAKNAGIGAAEGTALKYAPQVLKSVASGTADTAGWLANQAAPLAEKMAGKFPRIVSALTPSEFASGQDLVTGAVANLPGELKQPQSPIVPPMRQNEATGSLPQEDVKPVTPEDMKRYQDTTPEAPQKTSSNAKGGFGTIANFLAQAQQSSNPTVIAAAQAAQSQVDPQDPDAARKIAMALQSTPEGRAVGNSDSSLNA